MVNIYSQNVAIQQTFGWSDGLELAAWRAQIDPAFGSDSFKQFLLKTILFGLH